LEASSGQPHQRWRLPLLRAVASAPTARQQQRPPSPWWLAGNSGHHSAHEEVLAPVHLMRVRTRPSKNVATTSIVYDVLYDPSDGVGTVRPAVRGTPRTWRTCARGDRRPCGGRTATPRSAAGDSVEGGTKAIKAKEMEPQHGSLPTPRYWGVWNGAVAQPAAHLYEAGNHPYPRMLEEEAGKSVASTDIPRR
jgi:hypothetical protein